MEGRWEEGDREHFFGSGLSLWNRLSHVFKQLPMSSKYLKANRPKTEIQHDLTPICSPHKLPSTTHQAEQRPRVTCDPLLLPPAPSPHTLLLLSPACRSILHTETQTPSLATVPHPNQKTPQISTGRSWNALCSTGLELETLV